MPGPATATWNSGASGPTTVDQLRKKLTELARKKTGKALISDKFTKDHVFSGHAGSPEKLGMALAKLRELPASTLLITSMDVGAQKEVLNWIANVPAAGLTYRGGIWTVANQNTGVAAVTSYKWATVDLPALKGMNRDDVVKKSRVWLTVSTKTPKIACRFAADGTPMIYHLDY
jgi:hypothetical protein